MYGRQNFLIQVLTVAMALFPATGYSAPTDIDITRESGEIRGSVDFCGASDAGIHVYIPGKSFSAYTDANGQYVLSYVPEGTWTLAFARNGLSLGPTISGVVVVKRQATDVNQIANNPFSPGPYVLCPDLDGDGFYADTDCGDTNPRVNPEAPEFCGDGLDNNCNGLTDESCPDCTDNDADGFYAQLGCGLPDCNDSSAAVNPGAPEVCDGSDNNCDNQVDEATALDASTFYLDTDLDGFGGAITATACVPPAGYISVGGDCDESNIDVFPGATERCNGIDDNCDGLVDNECTNQACSNNEINSVEACMTTCTTANFLQCTQQCVAAVSSGCSDAIIQLATCGVSAECIATDGASFSGNLCLYENCPVQWESVFGNVVPAECNAGDTRICGSDVGACESGLQSCVNGRWAVECIGAVGPQPEICDGIDNDCDEAIDNGEVVDGQLFYLDRDNDGFGDPNASILACPGGDNSNLNLVNSAGDCDDEASQINPGATEYCDGRDNNCDGQVDEADPALGNTCTTGSPGVCSAGTRQCLNGVLACSGTTTPTPETCDGLDNDCDGAIDNGEPADGQLFYYDNDNDGFGDPNAPIRVCPGNDNPGLVANATDCDDGDAYVNPDGWEICDGLDNNCDGQVDETFPGEGLDCAGTTPQGNCTAATQQCVNGTSACVPTCSNFGESCSRTEECVVGLCVDGLCQ